MKSANVPALDPVPLAVAHSIDDYLRRLQPPNFHQIAPTLRKGKQHVLWNPELRPDGTIEKPPYRPRPALYHGNKYHASNTDPIGWATFNEAKKAYERGGYAGTGRVINEHEYEDQYIIFMDMDHCIRAGTQEPNEVVREILDEMQTYSERSPTDGAHAFLITRELPPGLKNLYLYKGQKIEIYWTDRYSTLTGHRIAGTPPDVEERSAVFTALIQRWQQWQEENTGGGGVCV